MNPEHPSSRTPPAASKHKQLVMIVVLLVGLLIAVVTQPADEEASTVPLTAISIKTAPEPAVALPTKWLDKFAVSRELQAMELDAILQANLYLSPEVKPEPEAHEAVETITEFQIQASYGTGKDQRVLINGRIFRVGDALPDGRRIIGIKEGEIEIAP